MELKATVTYKGPAFAGKAPEIISQELSAAMTEAVAYLEGQVKRGTPIGVYGAQGGLMAGIHGEVAGKGTAVIRGIVAHQSPYGDVIEKGRTAGKGMPPEGSLLRWIQVKMGVGELEARRMEYVIRRKIGRKGFKGAAMFDKALNAGMATVTEIFNNRGFIITRRLGQ